ncbi:MAG: hypothetical protein QOG53_1055 [Frankiales bacterium]|jgi:hypothetical protein|nr:hypothetical protein [Frankiales bacterium]
MRTVSMATMTDLLTRPSASRRVRTPRPKPGSTVTAYAVFGGVAAAGAGLLVIAVVVIVTWAATVGGGAGAADALRSVGAIWLAAHRVTVTISGVDVALMPLGLLALPAYALLRAGRWLAHATAIVDLRGAITGGLTLGCAYGFAAALVASACTSTSIHPAAGQALVAGCLVGVLFGTAGVLRGAELVEPLVDLVPERAATLARAASAALVIVLSVGALFFIGALALHAGRVGELGSSLRPGPVGGFTLVLACLVYIPNGIVWGASYAVGPGFAVGAHTSVSPFGVDLGAVPSFPLFGALPADQGSSALLVLTLMSPVIAGAVAGVLVIRRLPAVRIREAAFWGFVSGVAAAGMLTVLAALSGGPAGPGRLTTVGPSAWQVGLAAALELGVVAAVAAAETQRRLFRG